MSTQTVTFHGIGHRGGEVRHFQRVSGTLSGHGKIKALEVHGPLEATTVSHKAVGIVITLAEGGQTLDIPMKLFFWLTVSAADSLFNGYQCQTQDFILRNYHMYALLAYDLQG